MPEQLLYDPLQLTFGSQQELVAYAPCVSINCTHKPQKTLGNTKNAAAWGTFNALN